MALKIVTPPLTEPITISDVEAQIQFALPDDQETLVEGYIVAVRQKVELALRRALVTQTHDLTMHEFPAPHARNPFAAIEIPLPPLQSVTITYLSTAGTMTALDAADYVVDTDSTPGRVTPAYGKTWPATLDYPGAVRVQFVAGYGGPLAWDAARVYLVDERMLYTNGTTYRKTATSAAGVLPTDATKWVVDHPGYAVPQCIRNWMLLNTANLYENRETIIIGSINSELDTLADSLLDPERWEVRV